MRHSPEIRTTKITTATPSPTRACRKAAKGDNSCIRHISSKSTRACGKVATSNNTDNTTGAFPQRNPNVQGTQMQQVMCSKWRNRGGPAVTSDNDKINNADAPKRNPYVQATKAQYNVCSSLQIKCRQLALNPLWASLGVVGLQCNFF